jgi:hypothetical protein
MDYEDNLFNTKQWVLPADKSIIRTFLSSEHTEKRSVTRLGVADSLDLSSSVLVFYEYGGAVNLTDFDARVYCYK